MTAPDYIAPALGLPLAGGLWAVLLLPYLAAWNRTRRANRKAAK